MKDKIDNMANEYAWKKEDTDKTARAFCAIDFKAGFNAAINMQPAKIALLKAELASAKQTISELQDHRKVQAELNRKLSALLAEYEECVEFYANPEHWCKDECAEYNTIIDDDCADYPHVTRDVRTTGGKRARELQKKWGKK